MTIWRTGPRDPPADAGTGQNPRPVGPSSAVTATETISGTAPPPEAGRDEAWSRETTVWILTPAPVPAAA
jgi:hypothetical protein